MNRHAASFTTVVRRGRPRPYRDDVTVVHNLRTANPVIDVYDTNGNLLLGHGIVADSINTVWVPASIFRFVTEFRLVVHG